VQPLSGVTLCWDCTQGWGEVRKSDAQDFQEERPSQDHWIRGDDGVGTNNGRASDASVASAEGGPVDGLGHCHSGQRHEEGENEGTLHSSPLDEISKPCRGSND
jgi:hypothetical protein